MPEITVNIPDDLYHQAKAKEETGTSTISWMARMGIERWVNDTDEHTLLYLGGFKDFAIPTHDAIRTKQLAIAAGFACMQDFNYDGPPAMILFARVHSLADPEDFKATIAQEEAAEEEQKD